MIKNLSEKPIAELQMEQAENWEKEDLLGKCVSTREGKPSFCIYFFFHYITLFLTLYDKISLLFHIAPRASFLSEIRYISASAI